MTKVSSSPISPQIATIEHQQLLALINSLSDGVIAIDASLAITLTNSAALDLLDTNTLVGRELSSAVQFFDSQGVLVNIPLVLKATQTLFRTREWALKYPDNSRSDLEVTISPVKSVFGSMASRGWVIVFRDITDIKSLEEERNDFISVASHELRTPIAVAEGNISNALFQTEKGGSNSEIISSLQTAHDQTIFLGNLINDLAMLSRANNKDSSANTRPFDIEKILKQLEHNYKAQAQSKNLQLHLNLGDNLGMLNSSELYVREILQNLISNAIKYTENGTVSIAAKRNPKGVRFDIVDSGIGISSSDQKQLFKKFFRSEDWRVKKAQGTGLGLFVTAQLVQLLGADLKMESGLGQGTKVQVTIPDLVPGSK